MPRPTHEDAVLLVQLAQWGAADHLNEAMNWMWSDQFLPDADAFRAKYPWGSEGSGLLLKIGNHFETLGTLWKQGLLNEDLIFDWLAVAPVWNRVKGPFLAGREMSGIPALWENFEAMANAQAARQGG